MENYKMQALQNNLTMSPFTYQICQRLNDLITVWSRAQVEACLVMLDAGVSSKQGILMRHVNNLQQSYSNVDFDDACDILKIKRSTIFNKVG
jgi:hypothetical protein